MQAATTNNDTEPGDRWVSIRFTGQLVIESVTHDEVAFRWLVRPEWSSKKLTSSNRTERIPRATAVAHFRDMGLMRIPPMKDERR